MNNCEKKLDALIDALGFDVEVSMTKKGRPYASFASSPAGVDVYKLDDDLCYECDSNYKLTKRNQKTVDVDKILRKMSFALQSVLHCERVDVLDVYAICKILGITNEEI